MGMARWEAHYPRTFNEALKQVLQKAESGTVAAGGTRYSEMTSIVSSFFPRGEECAKTGWRVHTYCLMYNDLCLVVGPLHGSGV